MKQRFSSLDVKVIAQELSSSLCTLRLSNIYDLSSRIFLLKFAKPDQRQSLVIDSGFRCHLTNFTRVTASAPSAFVVRLRKFLRTRRVTSVVQVGTDRIIEIQFSDGQYRLFLEFYAGGNVVLTDKELSIIAIFRIVSEGPDQEELRVGLQYSLKNRQNYDGIPPLSEERVTRGLQKALDKASVNTVTPIKKPKTKTGDGLRKALAIFLNEFPPMLLEHALRVANFDGSTSIEEVVGNGVILKELMLALEEAKRVSDSISNSDSCKGFIIAKSLKDAPTQQHHKPEKELQLHLREDLVYDDFQPFRPRQFEDDLTSTILEFQGFNQTVDEFFSSVESQKLESRLTEREERARRKLETAKQDHEKRIGGLQQIQELNVRKAQAIEGNLQRVQEAISAVNSLVAQGIGWPEVARLIETEQKRHNPVAVLIKLPLKLYENTITLLLPEVDFEDEPDFEGNETGSDVSDSEDEGARSLKSKEPTRIVDKRLPIDVDLAVSPWSNARQYYDQKRVAAVKEQRTQQSSAKALKSTERKINADLKRGLKQEKDLMRPQRNPIWFEKFVYFISSEGYLVLGGKDAQQNEIIYDKYLKKGDVYIHADLQGAALVIVKNKLGRSDDPIPPSTLSQAGTLVVCTSSAWDSKAVMSAWWVRADQVSKTASTGDFLPPGKFTITGTKSFLPPAQLLLGFGLLFKVSKQSMARHLKHRVHNNAESYAKSTAEDDDMIDNVQDQPKEDLVDETSSTRASATSGGGNGERREDELGVEYSSESHIQEPRDTSLELSPENVSEASEENDSDTRSEMQNPLQPERLLHGVSREYPNATSDTKSSISDGTDHLDLGVDIASEILDTNAVTAAYPARDLASTISTDEDGPRSVQHLSTEQLKHESQLGDASVDGSNLSAPQTSSQKSKTPSQTISKVMNPPPQVRGKKGKRSKLKTKYANQDEEDRALAMRLLGSTAAQEKAKEDIEAKASKEQEMAAAKERRRKQHDVAAEKGKEAERLRRLNFEEARETPDEVELEKMEDLDDFIGIPLPGDEILDALVICGPWDAVGSRCRWRVKLQPGSQKKGKAVKEILASWNAALRAWDKKKRLGSGEGNGTMEEEDKVRKREAELIRALREPEIVGIIPVGRVRAMVSNVDGAGKGKHGVGGGKSNREGKGSKRR